MSETEPNADRNPAAASLAATDLPARLVRLAMLSAFVGNGLVAVLWWVLMPAGFALSHNRFWLNGVWPILVFAVCIGGICSGFLRRVGVGKMSLLFLAITTFAATATARIIFPDIISSALVVGVMIGGIETIAAALAEPRRVPLRRLAFVVAAAIPFGGFASWALRPERPTTSPLNEACPWEKMIAANKSAGELPGYIQVSDRVGYMPFVDETIIRLGRMRMSLKPLLTFESATASGIPTVLARNRQVFPLSRLTQTMTADGAVCLSGPYDRLRIIDRGAIEVVSYTTLAEPIYSHLNSYCVLNITGHKALELEFSPCGAMRFEPKSADYPTGRPARFAYCDGERKFRVVEATSGEKGPFVTLSEGRSEPHEPLVLGIFEEGQRVVDVHFYDWPSQLSTSLSPTAGWRVTANAIEFQAVNDSHGNSSVTIWFALAATSVGRGWDTVGHAAGTYRNRIVVEPTANVEK